MSWLPRIKLLEKRSRDRVLHIINDTIGKHGVLSASVIIKDTTEAQRLTDDDLVFDIKDDLQAGTALAFWADGSARRNHKFDVFLGAGVAWLEYKGQGHSEWQHRKFVLGQDTGDSDDAELFAVAAALGLAVDQVRGQGSVVQTVRIFSDCRGVLQGLKNGTTMVLGPAGWKTWALQDIYDHADFLVARGVTVQLVWQKGHARSNGNILADQAAANASQAGLDRLKTKKSVWKKKQDRPSQIAESAGDSVEEWYWRANKHLLEAGRVEGDDDEVDALSEDSGDMDVSE